MARLTDIFQSKAQVRLLEWMLDNRQKVFSQSSIARFLNMSPSTVARVIEPLVKHNILLYDRFDRGTKILALNEEGEKTKLVMDFYLRLKNL